MEPQPLHTSTTTTTTTTPPRSSATCFVQGLKWTIISLFLFLSVTIAIAWLVLNPHEPGFRVTSLFVSNFSVSDSQLRGRYEVELNITNPNKNIQVTVERFNVWACYGSVGLSGAALLQPIYLENMSNKDVKVKLGLKDSPTKLAHKVVSQDMVKDWNKGIVNFDLKMLATITFKDGMWPTREKLLDIYCGDLDVGFVPIKNTGKLLGIGKDCHVRS
ncbi:NDR1/HIN1-like protein 26 [Gastrolobium bilobum]|uniref:NDR1/HIN1-like protein 26 n=1 Tax=Gastrolobium bilobum TaxID=150636 RepID=UPI002AB17131|nr:NDR1/HIN1-like protein 26 [Gastrolobium bilobum]